MSLCSVIMQSVLMLNFCKMSVQNTHKNVSRTTNRTFHHSFGAAQLKATKSRNLSFTLCHSFHNVIHLQCGSKSRLKRVKKLSGTSSLARLLDFGTCLLPILIWIESHKNVFYSPLKLGTDKLKRSSIGPCQ